MDEELDKSQSIAGIEFKRGKNINKRHFFNSAAHDLGLHIRLNN